MTEEDWAAWVAVKAVVEAEVRSEKNGSAMADELLKDDFTLELYKGFPGSFRSWDHQLRQAVLLASTDAVIALAPVEGALHEFNTLDTLGFDKPEFHCGP
jgi:ABC transporter substrate binding protein (PQQ-dependent alcohol dehydrogenase system)